MNSSTSTDAPPNAPTKRSRYLFALAAALFLAWFLWQLFGPSPPILVSKETTYITDPLLPSGLPDYREYVEQQLRDGATLENNAAVLMWQTMGPGTGSDALTEKEWEALRTELPFPTAENSNDYLPPLYCRANRRAIAAWLNEQGRLRVDESPSSDAAIQEVIHSDAWPLTEEGANELYDIVETYIDAAIDAPWSTDQLPPIAAWFEKHQAQLNLLVEASQRARLYSPDLNSITAGEQELLITMSLEHIQRIREITRILSARAMWLFGEGQHQQAWDNLLAIHRWARLAAAQRTIVAQLVGIAIDGIACEGTVTLLSNRNLPPDMAKRIQRDLEALGPPSDMAISFDEMERLYALDVIMTLQPAGAGTMLGEFVGSASLAPWLKAFDFMSFNWNAVLVDTNHWYDRFSSTSQLKNWDAKMQALAQIEQDFAGLSARINNPGNWIIGAFNRAARTQMLSAEIMDLWLSPLSACLTTEDRAKTQLDLTRLAAALAVYRAEHSRYPDQLAQLVPDVIKELPVDLYHAKAFIYQRTADGYLLYSTGPNGIDDGGSNELRQILQGRELPDRDEVAAEKLRQQIPTGADDLSIRVPVPRFRLPTPPN